MSIKDYKVEKNQGVSTLILYVPYGPQIPASQTDFEAGSVRLPDNTDWYLASAYAFARAIAGTPDVNVQDDGTDLGTDTALAAGAQTAITGVSAERIKGGSEVQVVVTTAGGETVDGLAVTLHFEPLYLYGRTAVTRPS
ncbi:MAG: hypothetical protein GTO15_06415 [Pseudomonas stutzeri]|nr:hypothetical protein [Stutzerimonas stutzeri]